MKKRTIQCSAIVNGQYVGKGARVLFVSGLSALMLSGIVSPPAMAEQVAAESVITTQAKKITGTVVDEQGQPMIGVTVRVQGGNVGTTTDLDGKFSLNASEGSV